jgi:D-xylose transport system substrate-binding protein
MAKVCPDCKVLYQNANANMSQQQQFNSVIAQGAVSALTDIDLDVHATSAAPR